MPKIVEYPLAPFDKVFKLAESVDYLGGSCTIQDCAASMKKKVTGGFGILISSGIKHDLVIRRRDRLLLSEQFNRIKFSYDNAEKIENQRISFFHPALYQKIRERFHDKELPVTMLPKLLIREFQVEPEVSEKIAGFFLDGVKQLHLLQDGKLLGNLKAANEQPFSIPHTTTAPPPAEKQVQIPFREAELPGNEIPVANTRPEKMPAAPASTPDQYTIIVKGKGLESTIVVHDLDDLVIVEALLSKIRKTL